MEAYPFECGVCGGHAGSVCYQIENYPAYLVPLPMAIAKEVVCPAIRVAICGNCSHLQQFEFDSSLQALIYEKYYSHYSVDSSECLSPHYRTPFEKFLEEVLPSSSKKAEKLLEIGCSSGRQVQNLSKYCLEYWGVDPSHRIETAIQEFPQHHFVRGYFPKDLGDSRFDVVISQFNLEHIIELKKFLSGVRSCLNPGGQLIIQVPDIGEFIGSKQPNFLAHEHAHYFTKPALERLLWMNGFEPACFGPPGPSLIVLAKKKDKTGDFSFPSGTGFVNEIELHAKFFQDRPDLPEQPILFYGVGPLLFWLLAGKGNARHCAFVDDNPEYTNRGLPGCGVPVQGVTSELLSRFPNVVLSLNQIYHKRVKEKLRSFGKDLKIFHFNRGQWTCEAVGPRDI